MSATTVVSHLSLTRRDHTDGCDNSVSNLEGLGPKKLSKARVLVEVEWGAGGCSDMLSPFVMAHGARVGGGGARDKS